MRAGVRKPVSWSGLVALLAAGVGVALGCGWEGTEHSVRFNRWHSERQFSRLPALPFSARERTTPDWRDGEGESYARAEWVVKETDALWARAEAAAVEGDLAAARKLLRDYLGRTGAGACEEYPAPLDCRARRNSARDQLDALAALDRGTRPASVAAYLGARRAYDSWADAAVEAKAERGVAESNPHHKFDEWRAAQAHAGGEKESKAETAARLFEPVGAALDAVPRETELEDNVAYLRAAVLLNSGGWREAVAAFNRLAEVYPRGEKREAALFNAGVLWMKGSRLGPNGAASYATEEDDACPVEKDEEWGRAVAAFTRQLREYPKGQYAGDARGWLAYLRLRACEKGDGLAEYYRMLADESNVEARSEALRSLSMTRRRATEEDMLRVESLLEDEPRAALAYAYHDIYNFATRGDIDVEVPEESNPYRLCKEQASDPCLDDFYGWEEKERDRLERAARRRELGRVASFATRMMLRTKAAADGGAFALRVAAADLEMGDAKGARSLAARALAAGPRGEGRASALWVRGVAEYKLKDLAAARRTFESLLAEFPEGDLSEGARRYVAMAAEDAGDLGAALEQYLALGYVEDTAYFLDVLMTPEQLAAFVDTHPDSPARDELLYSLGLRLMRDHRFAEARAAYARVRATGESKGAEYSYSGEEPCQQGRVGRACSDPKEPEWQEPPGVRAAWVARDLKTMEEMEHLEARAASAVGDEAKAEALYQLASYLYESSDLTFYNPLWKHVRFYAIYYDQQFRAPGEEQLMRRYMEEHEPLVRALKLYIQLADDYPRARAARDALYTAAVTHERLANFQLYWPGEYKQGLYAGQRFVGYDDVRRAYPGYRMPAGTYGWRPSTRTVSGGPAWPEPPKPKKLTGVERTRAKLARAELRVAQAWALFGEVRGGQLKEWVSRALRWCLALLVACVALLVFRLTRRSRRFLYRQFARRLGRGRARRASRPAYAPTSSYAAHVARGRAEGLSASASDLARGLLRLALHERGRAALALNLFTHGLLTLLLWSLLWAAR